MKNIILGWILLVGISNTVWCQDVEKITHTKMLRYADLLAKQKQFKASAEEYARTLTYFPSLTSRLDLFRSAFFLVEMSKDYDYALSFVQKISSLGKGRDLGCLTQVYKGKILYKMRHYDAALYALKLKETCTEPYKSEFSFLRTLTFMRKNEWKKASKEFKEINPKFLAGNNQTIIDIINSGKAIKQINPKISGTFSGILPGSGYFYAHQPKSGTAALLTTGLLAWGASSAFNKKETGVGVLLGFIGVGWYFGGIYGSVRAAERYNDFQMEQVINPLENISLNIGE
ncbi:MAG: hypothetical protein L6420_05605 [Elusimicrobia bacterium]|nr:hypothetical protein [Candidatus Omnitrophota bacterium]MCG2725720.1 hypothetical protein [Elusimicrobiota bacterium]